MFIKNPNSTSVRLLKEGGTVSTDTPSFAKDPDTTTTSTTGPSSQRSSPAGESSTIPSATTQRNTSQRKSMRTVGSNVLRKSWLSRASTMNDRYSSDYEVCGICGPCHFGFGGRWRINLREGGYLRISNVHSPGSFMLLTREFQVRHYKYEYWLGVDENQEYPSCFYAGFNESRGVSGEHWQEEPCHCKLRSSFDASFSIKHTL